MQKKLSILCSVQIGEANSCAFYDKMGKILDEVRKIIVPLSPHLHKGQAGRVAIVGGSKDYAGAPYFASMSTLRLGADLAHVVCQPKAADTIKTYSPDLIVHPDLSEGLSQDDLTAVFKGLLPRTHAVVVGPGLGRDPFMQSVAKIAIQTARALDKYIVIDADGLFGLADYINVVKGYEKLVLTPNVVEFARLCKALGVTNEPQALAKELDGVTVVQKGAADIITNGTLTFTSDYPGSVRRCGGQGDLLSGGIGTFLAWAACRADQGELDTDPERVPLLAAYGASVVVRHTSAKTFDKMRRSMQASDMLDILGPSFEDIFPETY